MNHETFEKLYHSDKPFSYGRKQNILENVKATEEQIDENLRKNDIYTRYKQYKKPRKYSPIYVYKPRELFQADLVSFTNPEYIKANDGYKYLFTAIDVFTKYAWVYPLKSKDCDTTKKCFEDILLKCGTQPEKLQTDRGSEFICAKFKNFLKSRNIHHYLSYSDRKCPVVERFNLTIQQILYKILDKNESFRWIDYIDKAMKIYNNRKHTTIKLSPIDAEKNENESTVRKIFLKRYSKANIKTPKPKYKLGDTVRIWKFKRLFDRGYHENFTTQYFKISKVLTNLPVVRYELEDILGEKIIGSFFENELVPFEGMDFHRTEVLDSKGKGKNKKYLVHYIGWPNKFNEWVSEDKLKDIQPENDSSDEEMVEDNQNVPNVINEQLENIDNDSEQEESVTHDDEHDDVQNDNNQNHYEANSFYEPYQSLQSSDESISNEGNFYEPFHDISRTQADSGNNSGMTLRSRKRKLGELKVNVASDSDIDKIQDKESDGNHKKKGVNRKKQKNHKKRGGKNK